jgi:hypothetical protein
LIAVIAIDWPHLDTSTRLVYSGLLLLDFYMLWRAWRALVRLRRQDPAWLSRYVDDIGFMLISLFDGFVIVLAIDLHAPGWLVALIAVAGILAIRRVKARLGAEPATS